MQSTENGNKETQIRDMYCWLLYVVISRYIDTGIEVCSLYYGMSARPNIIETTLDITLQVESSHWNIYTNFIVLFDY